MTENEKLQYQIRNAVDGMYDCQKLRIATGNRICAALSYANGVKNVEDTNDKALKLIEIEYGRITDYYATVLAGKGRINKAINAQRDSKYIKTEMDYELVKTYMGQLEAEQRMAKVVAKYVQQHPMWDLFFKDVKGCGPAMAGILISYLDIHKARHASSFWSYCGVGLKKNEEGKFAIQGAKNLVDMQYTDSNGEIKTKKGLGYNPLLKTKLLGVLGGSFLKAQSGNIYADAYYDYKNRVEQSHPDYTAAHRHNMAIRYAIKMFLRDLWVTWRKYEGYEVSAPYEVAFLGRKPHKYNEYAYRVANGTHYSSEPVCPLCGSKLNVHGMCTNILCDYTK